MASAGNGPAGLAVGFGVGAGVGDGDNVGDGVDFGVRLGVGLGCGQAVNESAAINTTPRRHPKYTRDFMATLLNSLPTRNILLVSLAVILP